MSCPHCAHCNEKLLQFDKKTKKRLEKIKDGVVKALQFLKENNYQFRWEKKAERPSSLDDFPFQLLIDQPILCVRDERFHDEGDSIFDIDRNTRERELNNYCDRDRHEIWQIYLGDLLEGIVEQCQEYTKIQYLEIVWLRSYLIVFLEEHGHAEEAKELENL